MLTNWTGSRVGILGMALLGFACQAASVASAATIFASTGAYYTGSFVGCFSAGVCYAEASAWSSTNSYTSVSIAAVLNDAVTGSYTGTA
jgi:hypothetical protein